MATTISERFSDHYSMRREISQPADLVSLLLRVLFFEKVRKTPAGVKALVERLRTGNLTQIEGRDQERERFTHWLWGYLKVNKTAKGVTFLPLHPALTLPDNGEASRVEKLVTEVARRFDAHQRAELAQALWTAERQPPLERLVYDITEWQLAEQPTGVADAPAFPHATRGEGPLSTDGILDVLVEDVLTLARETTSIRDFVDHAGRMMAFGLCRHLLVRGGVDLALPIYAAPASDTHAGVKSLAHEILEVHRSRLAQNLEQQFRAFVEDALAEAGHEGAPPDEPTARALVKELFHPLANVVPEGSYLERLREFGDFASMAHHYYWTQGSARGRFLRQLHGTHLNMAYKAGLANKRSRYSQWAFYWLASPLVETLALVSIPRHEPRVLVADLLRDWRDRYGIAVLIDESWGDYYRTHFRALGNPESLNEANLRRVNEVFAERGRLHKNSDDFPWAILRDK